MKQKYSITVADMELSIISDASPDEVENIVCILDRRMRDINLKSPRCTKNEAAILCALSYCSERIAMQEAFKKIEKDAFRFASENEKLKKVIEGLQTELDTLRKDASVMRSILDRASISVAPEAKPVAQAQKKDSAPEQLSAFDNEAIPAMQQPEASAASADEKTKDAEPVENAEEKSAFVAKKNAKSANKNHVGSMFDLLTFSDI